MNRYFFSVLALGISLFCITPMKATAIIDLTLIPSSGDISGSPGSTIGWGYSITNNSSEWIGTLDVSADNFTNGTPNVIFDYPGVAPDSTVSLPFSLTATSSCSSPPCGLYDLVWDSAAPIGSTNSGTFIISSDFFSGDPLNPAAIDLGPAPDASASYTATVSGSIPTTAPEPASAFIALAGLFALCAISARKRFS